MSGPAWFKTTLVVPRSAVTVHAECVIVAPVLVEQEEESTMARISAGSQAELAHRDANAGPAARAKTTTATMNMVP
jgi:hypothetical protein